jgi:hypothetical protein
MLVSFLGFGLLFAWMVVHRYRLEVLEERYETEGFAFALQARRAESRDAGTSGRVLAPAVPAVGTAAAPAPLRAAPAVEVPVR